MLSILGPHHWPVTACQLALVLPITEWSHLTSNVNKGMRNSKDSLHKNIYKGKIYFIVVLVRKILLL